MKLRQLFAGIAIGVGAGVAIGSVLEKNNSKNRISPSLALAKAKEIFSKDGEITASWIHMTPEDLEHLESTHRVYHGGLSVAAKGKTNRYEFFVDTTLGTLVHFVEVDSKVA